VEQLETGLGCGHIGNRGALAPRWISSLLDAAFAASGPDGRRGVSRAYSENTNGGPIWVGPNAKANLNSLVANGGVPPVSERAIE
jgi:hypothetical protein